MHSVLLQFHYIKACGRNRAAEHQHWSDPVTEKTALAGLFPAVNEDTWREQAEKLLKGRSFDSLTTRTSDGLTLQPLYAADAADRSAPGSGDRRRGASVSNDAWHILERVQHPNPKQANQALLAGLSTGATALQLIFQPDAYETTSGVRAVTASDITKLLDGVLIDALPVLVDAGGHATSYGEALLAHASVTAKAPEELTLLIAADPAAALASMGTLPGSKKNTE